MPGKSGIGCELNPQVASRTLRIQGMLVFFDCEALRSKVFGQCAKAGGDDHEIRIERIHRLYECIDSQTADQAPGAGGFAGCDYSREICGPTLGCQLVCLRGGHNFTLDDWGDRTAPRPGKHLRPDGLTFPFIHEPLISESPGHSHQIRGGRRNDSSLAREPSILQMISYKGLSPQAVFVLNLTLPTGSEGRRTYHRPRSKIPTSTSSAPAA